MKRLKTMGLAMAMALTITAMLGVASATASQFRAEEYPTSATSTQSGTHTFTTELSKKLNCSTATGSGTMSAASNSLTLTPAYSGCVWAGTVAAAKANSCQYVLHSTNESIPYTGSVDISCSKEGDGIEFTTAICKMKLPQQTALGSVSVSNTFGKKSRNRTFSVELNLTGVKYTETGVACAAAGTHLSGSYSGNSVIKGANTAAKHAVGVYVANEQQESPPFFEAEDFPVNVQAQQSGGSSGVYLPHVGASMTCSTMTGISAWGDFATEVSQSIKTWSGCNLSPSISMNTCSFTLHPVTSEPFPFEAPEFIAADGSMGIACSKGGDAIKFTVFGACEIQIPAQNGLNGVHFENTGAGASRAINAEFSLAKLKYTESKGCPSQGTHEDGSLFGKWTLKGYVYKGVEELGAQKGIQVG